MPAPSKIWLVKNEKIIPFLRDHFRLGDDWKLVGNKSAITGDRFDVVFVSMPDDPIEAMNVRGVAVTLCRSRDAVYLEV